MNPIRPRLEILIPCLTLACAITAAGARADTDVAASHTPATPADSGAAVTPAGDGLEHLVPELGARPYALDPGVRPYLHRLSISPGFGRLGTERLFLLRRPTTRTRGSATRRPSATTRARPCRPSCTASAPSSAGRFRAASSRT